MEYIRGGTVNSYKLVNSREVQEKAFRLGCNWIAGQAKTSHLSESFLIIDENMVMTVLSDNAYFSDHNNQEITQADFLALPEPVKVGDWIKFASNDRVVIFKVAILNNENEAFWLDSSIDDRYFNLDYCTKLTQQQIDILGLED